VKPDEIILQVIQGVRPLEDLGLVGIGTGLTLDARGYYSWQGEMLAELDTVITPADLAMGLTKLWSTAEEQRRWAFILEGCTFWSFADGEEETITELLLDALWALSFGDPPPPAAIELARNLLA
jgi:hypothetical protein